MRSSRHQVTMKAYASNRDGLITSIYAMNPDGSDVNRITNTFPASDQAPAWSPDGARIAFYTNEGGIGLHIALVNADGTGRTGLAPNTALGVNPAWSSDGTRIAFSSTRDGNGEIYVMNADGTGQVRLTTNSLFDDNPSWSADGTKIAFERNLSGQDEVFVMNADGTGETNLTNNNPGPSDSQPNWQRATAIPTPTPTPTPGGCGFGGLNCPTRNA
jgi:Tol biopolymer transport system component